MVLSHVPQESPEEVLGLWHAMGMRYPTANTPRSNRIDGGVPLEKLTGETQEIS